MLNQQQSGRIITELANRGVRITCPVCQPPGQLSLNATVGTIPDVDKFFDNGVPIATLVCVRCGYVQSHALVAIGLDSIVDEMHAANQPPRT